MKKLLLITITCGAFLNNPVQAENYCLAIRGNGPAIPAHWGALARIVENYGTPEKMAGGSSASITMFLAESVFAQSDLSVEEQAYLIKSFEGLFFQALKSKEIQSALVLSQSPELRALAKKLTEMAKAPQLAQLSTLSEVSALLAKYQTQVMALWNSPHLRDLINPELIGLISETQQKVTTAAFLPAGEEKNKLLGNINFRWQQLQTAFKTFGKFDVATDPNIFFRPGLVNFPGLARLYSKLADFYALNNMSADLKSRVQAMTKQCAVGTKGLSWRQILGQKPQCQAQLENLMSEFSAQAPGTNGRLDDMPGKYISSFPATSILRGQAALQFEQFKKDYTTTSDPNFGDLFHPFAGDVLYGYWGAQLELEKVSADLKMLYPSDSKSKKFFPLANQTWREILALSPTEPGLANIQTLPGQAEKLYSAGGWADLHPVQILKAAGCANVVYMTRRDGDALFGQGVAKKLLGLEEVAWTELTQDRNNQGSADLDSQWSSFYNLANPNSSFSLALQQASAIYCTNWNSPDLAVGPQTGISALIEDAYNSPVYYAPTSQLALLPLAQINDQNIELEPGKNFKKYVGCVPGLF